MSAIHDKLDAFRQGLSMYFCKNGVPKKQLKQIFSKDIRTCRRMEKGETKISLEDLIRVADFLKVHVSDLFFINPETGKITKPKSEREVQLEQENEELKVMNRLLIAQQLQQSKPVSAV